MKLVNKYKLYSISIVSLVYCFIFIYIFQENYNPIPGSLSIPNVLCFVDLNVVIESTECFNNGFNPYLDKNSFCVHNYNYPLIWLHIFSLLGVTSKFLYFIGFSLIFLNIVLIVSIFEIRTFKKMVFISLLFFSPPFYFLYERNNVDLVIFNILLFGFYFIRNHIRFSINHFIVYGVVIFLSFLKLYPCVLIVLVFIESFKFRRKITIFLTLLSVFLIYIFLIKGELVFISQNSLYPSEWSFGRNVLLQEYFEGSKLVFISFFPVFFLSCFYLFKRVRLYFDVNIFRYLNDKSKESWLCFAGLMLYLFQFFIGNHYDFRLVFLVLTLPQFLKIYSNIYLQLNTKKIVLIYLLMIFIVFSFSFIHLYLIPFKNYNQWFIGRNSFMYVKYIVSVILCSFALYYFCFILITNFTEKQIDIKNTSK